jgi:hypothetical protein
LVFITGRDKNVYSAVRTESLYETENFYPCRVNVLPYCLYGRYKLVLKQTEAKIYFDCGNSIRSKLNVFLVVNQKKKGTRIRRENSSRFVELLTTLISLQRNTHENRSLVSHMSEFILWCSLALLHDDPNCFVQMSETQEVLKRSGTSPV